MAPEQAVYLKRLARRHFERQEGIYYGHYGPYSYPPRGLADFSSTGIA
jgi:hypothetical protein